MTPLPDAYINATMRKVTGPPRKISLNLAIQVVLARAESPEASVLTDLHGNYFQVDAPDFDTTRAYVAEHYLSADNDHVNPTAIIMGKIADDGFRIRTSDNQYLSFFSDGQEALAFLLKAGLIQVSPGTAVNPTHGVYFGVERGALVFCDHAGTVLSDHLIEPDPAFLASISQALDAIDGWTNNGQGIYVNLKQRAAYEPFSSV